MIILKVLYLDTVCPVSWEMRWAPAKFAFTQVASHAFISVTVLRASSCSRHQNGSVHNTSLFAVTVRPTLIIYLLQFRLFSSIFHISSPHAPLPFTPLNGRRKKTYVCVSGIQCCCDNHYRLHGIEYRPLLDCFPIFASGACKNKRRTTLEMLTNREK